MPLNKLKNFIVPQDNVFFELMQQQAQTAQDAAEALYDLLKHYENVDKKTKKIKDFEHQGDDLMRTLYTALNKTFIVPIDHEDISTLAGALDDVVDLIDRVSTLLMIYEISAPSQAMIDLADSLVEQTKELKKAVHAIDHSKTYNKVTEHCNKIKQMEMKSDEIYVRAIALLYKKSEPIEIMKQKEIMDCLEAATDTADKAAQHISDIVMKHS